MSTTREIAAISTFNRGLALRELGRWEEAIVVFDELIARDGDRAGLPGDEGADHDGAIESSSRKTGIRSPRRRRSALPDCVETSTLAARLTQP